MAQFEGAPNYVVRGLVPVKNFVGTEKMFFNECVDFRLSKRCALLRSLGGGGGRDQLILTGEEE